MSYSKHLKEHTMLGTPNADENGVIQAQVALRTDTLANLLLVANAGIGEVAVATDVNALVVYKGAPSVGVAYYMSKEALFAYSLAEITTLPGATATTLKFSDTGATVDPLNILDGAAETITIPNMGLTKVTLTVRLQTSTPSATATYIHTFLEYDVTGGGVWIPTGDAISHFYIPSTTLTLVSSFGPTVATIQGKKVRIRCLHNGTADLVVTTILTISGINFS